MLTITTGKVSPDAFVQLAMQLAWFRATGSFTATYETVLTRLFHNGRTETIRTFSKNARSFVLAMQDAKTSVSSEYAKIHAEHFLIYTHTPRLTPDVNS